MDHKKRTFSYMGEKYSNIMKTEEEIALYEREKENIGYSNVSLEH